MKTTDLFKVKAGKINESIHKAFGKKLNLETFDIAKLEDARNKLRTQISQVRNSAGFNENLENDAFHQAQFMLDAINAELAEREEAAIDSLVAQSQWVQVDSHVHSAPPQQGQPVSSVISNASIADSSLSASSALIASSIHCA